MWTCVSKQRLRVETFVLLGALAAATLAFGLIQNHSEGTGGKIALPKLLWLAYALLAWFLLPPVIARDAGASLPYRRVFVLFFWCMAVRGAAELAMMYVWRSWHPHYGAVHDMFCAALILALHKKPATSTDVVLRRHILVLAGMLLAETSFALYFAANFETRGDGGLYFVPWEERYFAILMFTAAAVVCLSFYFPWFLRRWLYTSDESGSKSGSGTRRV